MENLKEQPNQESIERWHRWFAVECNNRGWDLAAQPERTTVEERELLNAAYAAAFHWSKVGRPINDARADTLLAQAHALLGHGELALFYARRCLDFCTAREDTAHEGAAHEVEDWDLAYAHAMMAHAAALMHNTELHAHHYAVAQERGAALPDEAERQFFAQEFARVPPAVSA